MRVRRILFLMAIILFACLDGGWVWAEEKEDTQNNSLENCAYYRAKKDGTAVFSKATRTSRVIYRLSLGEYVCHIGERGEFAIIDWRLQDEINKREKNKRANKKQEVAFVRLVELWEDSRSHTTTRPEDMAEQVKQYFYYMRYGGVPDDVFGPLRPLIGPLIGSPECKAGKLCEEIKKQQEGKGCKP